MASLFAACPKCETQFAMDKLVSGNCSGSVFCPICNIGFDFTVTKSWLGNTKCYTSLRSDPPKDPTPIKVDLNG